MQLHVTQDVEPGGEAMGLKHNAAANKDKSAPVKSLHPNDRFSVCIFIFIPAYSCCEMLHPDAVLQPHRVTKTKHPEHTFTFSRSLFWHFLFSDHTAPPHFFGSSVRSKNSQVVLTDKRWCEAA